jgi:flagellar biogenesis protein FliO
MDLVRQSLAITLVFALLGAALWLLKRRGVIRPGSRQSIPGLLESRGKLSLTAQHSVHLVRVADRSLVLAVHPAGITLVCNLAAGAAQESKRESAA